MLLWSKNYEKRVTLVMIYLISSKRSFWGNVAIYVVEAFAEGILNNGDINYMQILEEFLFRTFR